MKASQVHLQEIVLGESFHVDHQRQREVSRGRPGNVKVCSTQPFIRISKAVKHPG